MVETQIQVVIQQKPVFGKHINKKLENTSVTIISDHHKH